MPLCQAVLTWRSFCVEAFPSLEGGFAPGPFSWYNLPMVLSENLDRGPSSVSKEKAKEAVSSSSKEELANLSKAPAEYALPELTTSKFEEISGSEEPAFVVISATWCKECKKTMNALAKLGDAARKEGKQLNIFTITDDTNEDAENLYAKLGIKSPDTLPTLLFKGKSEGIEFSSHTGVADDEVSLSKFLKEKGGVEVDALLAKAKELEKNEEDYKELAESDPENAMKALEEYIDEPYAEAVLGLVAKNTDKKGPLFVLMFFEKFAHKPYAKKILELAARNSAKTNTQGALEFYDTYSGEPYEEEVLETAVRTAAGGKDPIFAVWYIKKYAGKAYFDEILDSVAKKEETSRSIFEAYAKWLKRGFGDKEDLKIFAQKVRGHHPELADEFKDLI